MSSSKSNNLSNDGKLTDKKSLFMVVKTEADKIESIKNNVILMLSRRIYIDKAGVKHPLLDYEKSLKKVADRGDNTFVIDADNKDLYAFKIVFQKITTTGKQSTISDFFKDYVTHKKILIATDFNKKIISYVSANNTQIFKESSLTIDILSHRDQPRFELLTHKEMAMVKKEYNISDYTTKKILRTDAVAKYFALKKGEIVRIIRPSLTSGDAIDYRIVS